MRCVYVCTFCLGRLKVWFLGRCRLFIGIYGPWKEWSACVCIYRTVRILVRVLFRCPSECGCIFVGCRTLWIRRERVWVWGCCQAIRVSWSLQEFSRITVWCSVRHTLSTNAVSFVLVWLSSTNHLWMLFVRSCLELLHIGFVCHLIFSIWCVIRRSTNVA